MCAIMARMFTGSGFRVTVPMHASVGYRIDGPYIMRIICLHGHGCMCNMSRNPFLYAMHA